MSGPDWYQVQHQIEQWLQEQTCEHGIHPDSGHVCVECLVNNGDEDGNARPE